MEMTLKSAQWGHRLRRCFPRLILGLDVGSQAAKAVLVRHGRMRDVLRAETLVLPPHPEPSLSRLLETLVPWLAGLREIGGRDFIGSLPSEMVDYESWELSESELIDEEIRRQADQTLQQLLGEECNAVSGDYWVSQHLPGQVHLHLTWTSSQWAGGLVEGSGRAGWSCRQLEPPVLALARAGRDHQPLRPRLVADLGPGTVTLVWTVDGQPHYLRNRIRFAAVSAVDAVATALSLSPPNVETLLKQWGVVGGESAPISQLLQTALEDWLDQLAFELRRTTHYLQHRHGPQVVEELVLCGRGAEIAGLPNWLTERVGLPVREASLPPDTRWLAAQPFGPGYAQALALARCDATP